MILCPIIDGAVVRRVVTCMLTIKCDSLEPVVLSEWFVKLFT